MFIETVTTTKTTSAETYDSFIMSSSCIQTAKNEFDASLVRFQFFKSTVSRTLESTVVAANKEQLKSLCQDFEKSLEDLNRSWTIWRCRYEERFRKNTFINEGFSESWLEGLWYEYSDLYDQLDEIVYSIAMNQPINQFQPISHSSASGVSLPAVTPVVSHSSTSGGLLATVTLVDSHSLTYGGSHGPSLPGDPQWFLTYVASLSALRMIVVEATYKIFNNPLIFVPAANIQLQPKIKPPALSFGTWCTVF